MDMCYVKLVSSRSPEMVGVSEEKLGIYLFFSPYHSFKILSKWIDELPQLTRLGF